MYKSKVNRKRHFEIRFLKHHKKQKTWVCEEILNFLDVGSYQPDTMGIGGDSANINVSIIFFLHF